MSEHETLTVRITRQKQTNQFCPRCGVIIPIKTNCIPSPTHGAVEYHPNCFYAMAEHIGGHIHFE